MSLSKSLSKESKKTKVFTVPVRNLKLLTDEVEIKISEDNPLYVKFGDTEILISNLKEEK